MTDLIQAAGVFVAIIVPTISAAAWLIQRGIAHQAELSSKSQADIERRIGSIEETVKASIFELRKMETSGIAFKTEIRIVISKLDEMMKELRDTSKMTEQKLNQFEKSTVKWLTDELAIVKGGKAKP
jgi:hypothetical protein